MDSTYQRLSEALSRAKSIAIVTPKDPSLDQMAASLSLYLSLSSEGRNVAVATPSEPLVELSSLVGIDKVKTTINGPIGDLIVSFPYREGEIDKVSYTLEGDTLNILVKAGELGLSFNEKDVKYTRPTSAPDLMFVVGAPRISDLGKLFDATELKDTTVVNIDNSAENQGYGDIVFVSTRLSSISEEMANLLFNIGLKVDTDIAQNLMWGIMEATDNFQNSKTSVLAFQMAAELMRMGAVREPHKEIRTAFTPGTLPQTPAMQRVQEQIDQLKKTSIEQSGMSEQKGNLEAPDDWLAPKIYKGSTSFES